MKLAFPMPHMLRLKATMQPWEAQVNGADQTRMAKRADELGYDMIYVPEHFIIPRNHVELSGPHYFHSQAAQGYLAGATQRIRIGTSITILPLQHPIVMAKALSTLDWLSSGRIEVTFGVGWLEGEFELLGVPFRERGRMADEYLEAIIALWTQESPSFDGKYVSFKDVAFEPKPVQKPYLPIWMGGDTDAALKRTAKYASGWSPFLTKTEDIPARIDFIKSQPTYKGGPLEVMRGMATERVGEGHKVNAELNAKTQLSSQQIVDQLGRLKNLGVTISGVPIPPVQNIEAYLDYAQWIIEEVKPKLM
ncbi:MAG: LLM class F420-dependent oxidoreductase [Spongiibacteraceae bacterium]